ncbi:putative RING finger protein nhl-1 [Penaeus vannamei]|uniref:Putative RING finger protein nhl-1 n=1 Tax=Penaeus vannamei TaxID=6689 RepID=A0A3R7PWY5_PENVA|nr:putative RING finger protein nhl-1 [Penaeus vannamei]
MLILCKDVKCPECRAEHRIPYNGVQGFPSNVTLQRFLEAHIEITGEAPDPHTGGTFQPQAEHRRSVTEEIENICVRLQKSLRDRCDFLKTELENYYQAELRNLTVLKEGLDQEVSNIGSNIELAEKHMDDDTPWDDTELMDAKDIFLKTMEFIRSFDYEAGDYSRRARFNPPDDLNKLSTQLSTLGDITFSTPNKMNDSYSSGPCMGSGLMKSKSDHRLAAQYRDQDDSYGGYTTGRTSPLMRRRFGERNVERHDEDSSADSGRRRFRSRFMRKEEDEERSVRFSEEDGPKRNRVIDTEDVSRGPLSGIVRITDSPRQRRRDRQDQEAEQGGRVHLRGRDRAATPSGASTPSTPTTPKPAGERVSSIREDERQSRSDRTSTSPRSSANHSPSSSVTREDDRRRDYSASGANGSTPSRKTSVDTSVSHRSYPFSRSSSNSSVGDKASGNRSPRTLEATSYERKLSRSNSTDSNSGDGAASPKKNTGAAFSTEELRNRFMRTDSKPSTSKAEASRSSGAGSASRFSSRFLGRAVLSPGRWAIAGAECPGSRRSRYGASASSSSTDSGLGSHRRPSYMETKAPSKEKDDDFDSKYPFASKILSRSRANVPEEESKHPFQSRFLNRSKSSAVLGPDDEDSSSTPSHGSSRARFEELKERRQRLARSKSSAGLEDDETSSADTSSASAYRPRYGRTEPETSTTSRTSASSSGASGGGEEGGSSSTQLSNWARYLKNKYGNRSSTGESSSSTPSGRNTSIGLGSSSSGLGSSTSSTSGAGSSLGSSRTSTGSALGGRAISRSRSSHLLGLAKEGESSEDDSKNVHATPTSQQAGILVPTQFGSLHRSQYLQKQRLLLKIGSRGSEPGNFTWPRGIAVGPDNSIVVADSSNHRVQVFDQHGKFVKEFGSYGSAEGEFDCLAGVAVNRIGQFIIADRYNHRIQIFDPSGMFLRAFGSQGSGDGRFSYPWGVTTDALGFIYVCDKENHRVQVFQSDGSFVGKFGSMGNKPAQLEHPHYIAVSSTNRVIVSDSNNHRIQVFDINGKVTNTFGAEGSAEGQFKFPRGVAVDDQGYIFVADSGNNRIQIFHPDGAFLRAFGCWGSGEGEFKGLEGVAVMSNGNILVCDRENHRVQVF